MSLYSLESNRSKGWRVRTGEHFHQSGFSGSIVTYESHNFTGMNFQTDVRKCDYRAVVLRDVLNFVKWGVIDDHLFTPLHFLVRLRNSWRSTAAAIRIATATCFQLAATLMMINPLVTVVRIRAPSKVPDRR